MECGLRCRGGSGLRKRAGAMRYSNDFFVVLSKINLLNHSQSKAKSHLFVLIYYELFFRLRIDQNQGKKLN